MGTVEPGVKYPRELLDYEGIPSGWKAIEQAYGEKTKSAGSTYIRFHSPCGVYKSVGSQKKCFEFDYESRGLDPADGAKAFLEMKEKKKKEREENGKLTGERKEEAIQMFEAKFGKLEAAVIPKIPGWSYRAKYLEVSGQTHIVYFDAKGNSFGTVKQVESAFGLMLMNGQDCSFIDAAREAFIAEHGSLDPGFNPLRRTADGSTLQDCVALGDLSAVRNAEAASSMNTEKLEQLREGHGNRMRKRRRTHTVIREVDYQEFTTVIVERCNNNAASNASAKALNQSPAQIEQLLKQRGFKNVELIAVYSSTQGHDLVDGLSGFFYKRPQPFNERACFQWLKLVQDKDSSRLACGGVYVYWSSGRNRWQIGCLGGDSNCIMFNLQNEATPWNIKQPWMALRGDFFD